MSSYGWRPSHRQIESILWYKIALWFIFQMPPVWGQSASLSISYVRFTEEWSVCLARGSCRGDEGLSIDNTALVSIDSDSRTWAKHISSPFEAQKPHQVTKIPMDDKNPIYVFLNHCWRQQTFYYHIILFSLRFGEKINSPLEIDWNFIGFTIDLSIILFRLWFVLLLACLSNSSC